jgi:flavodoxin
MTGKAESGNGKPKVLVVVCSYHHGNTRKVAEAMAEELGAEIRTPDQVSPETLAGYGLVGFGAGIDSGHHYKPLLDLADRLPNAEGRTAFIFSTCGIPASLAKGDILASQIEGNHAALREKLRDRGYRIVGEWGCVGFNTTLFLKFFGGLNKGRPDANDLAAAKGFAVALRPRFSTPS